MRANAQLPTTDGAEARPGRFRWIVLALIVSTFASLLFCAISYTAIVFVEKESAQPKAMLLWLLIRFYLWAAMSPLVVLMARRFRIGGGRARKIIIHFGASIAFSLLHVAIYLPLFWLVAWPASRDYLRSVRSAVGAGLNTVFPLGVIVYWVILAIAISVDLYRQNAQERERAAALQSSLLESRLNALRMQLQPHFLFNTLHSLSDLVLEDQRAATRMIARLGDFLRLTLDNSGSQLVTLQTELEFVRCYLEIEQVRFQDRLTVSIGADAGTESAMVPNLILQPLVENAILHGISRRIGPGNLEISAEQNDGYLDIRIRDDGPGFSSDEDRTGRRGVGLSNVRERLRYLYGQDNLLILQNDTRGGMCATIRIPSFRNQLKLAADEDRP